MSKVEYEEEIFDDDEEDVGALPSLARVQARGRRTSVSAESMKPTDDKDYQKVVIEKSQEQRKRIRESVKNNFLFKNLDDEQYDDVVNAMAEKKVNAKVEVIKQGGVGDYFYIVESGSFDVFVAKSSADKPVKVAEYGPGGSFGELALMYNAPRAATIVSTSAGVLWALDRVTFRRILMESTSRKRKMYEKFLEEVPILKSLEPYERNKIADALESVSFKEGDVVLKQGEVGDNFYLIEAGEASVAKKEDDGSVRKFPNLKKGDYFGELALLTNKPRAATITAAGKLKCATLGKQAFDRLLGPALDIIKRNTEIYKSVQKDLK